MIRGITAFLFVSCGLCSAAIHDNIEQSRLVIESKATPVTFQKGVKLFTDREYTALDIPAVLDGGIMLQASIDGIGIVARNTGVVYALTPEVQPNAASQEPALRSSGFELAELPSVQLFPGEINRVRIYSKILDAGESCRFGKWVILVMPKGGRLELPKPVASKPWSENDGELLYNGIQLPASWPPLQTADSLEPMAVPYLKFPPKVINIQIGRQLFVDDFLIESTTLKRTFYQAEKYPGNPVLKAETKLEKQDGLNAIAAPFGDGVFYDPKDRMLKMWYHAGWFDGTALATSIDGITWQRPELNVVPGTNRVLANSAEQRRDAASVWFDTHAKEPADQYKMLIYNRRGQIGGALQGGELTFLTSANGVSWNVRDTKASGGDNTTFFFNPFRGKWIFAIKTMVEGMRVRRYWESSEFVNSTNWNEKESVPWVRSDRLDKPDPQIGIPVEVYKIDAVAYESIIIGMFQMMYGPWNEKAAELGQPKVTDLMMAYSRDGFHWDRPNRKPFIAASRSAGKWDRGYIGSAGGVCIVGPDRLYFYYSGFSGGDGTRDWQQTYWSEMYANGATGLATLRRDGFASMDAENKPGFLTTRKVSFGGSYLFVNADSRGGELRVEILGDDGKPIDPFTKENCVPLVTDGTKSRILWRGAPNLDSLRGKTVRFRFHLTQARLFSFWVSKYESGESDGFLGAGGPGYTNNRDTR